MTRKRIWARALLVWTLSLGVLNSSTSVLARSADPTQEPSVLRGTGKAIGGFLWELPKTIVEVTAIAPPLITVGVVAGTLRAAHVAFHGLEEMNEAFDPWETKQSQRSGHDANNTPRTGSSVTPGFEDVGK